MGSTGRDLHFDAPLSNVAINYKPSGMIADMVAPLVPVQKQSDHYVIFDQADSFRIEDTKRAPGTWPRSNSACVRVSMYCAPPAIRVSIMAGSSTNVAPASTRGVK